MESFRNSKCYDKNHKYTIEKCTKYELPNIILKCCQEQIKVASGRGRYFRVGGKPIYESP